MINKLVIFVFICLFCYTRGWGRGDLEKYGPFNLILHSKFIKCNHERNLDLDVNETDVYYYDFPLINVESFSIDNAAQGILNIDTLDKTKKFFIFVGGYRSQINKNSEGQIRDAFSHYPNSYLIMLDHSPYTNDKQGIKTSYERSVKYVYYIGKALANMLIGLYRGGISPKNMHCIGHSLGSQMLAHTGQIFYENTGQKIWRITALDPAGPCFSNSLIEEQIRSGVAEYVEVYHCNAGGLGSSSVLGDIDFFVNKKGATQPNCGTPLIPGFGSSKAAKCAHSTCIDMWTASVRHPELFPAWQCDSYKEFKKGSCSSHDRTTAGLWNPGNATGVYYFTTEGYNLS